MEKLIPVNNYIQNMDANKIIKPSLQRQKQQVFAKEKQWNNFFIVSCISLPLA